MEKSITLKLSSGSLSEGFVVILQMMTEEGRIILEMQGILPPAPELEQLCKRWQVSYRRLGLPYRLEAKKSGFVTNVSIVADCQELAEQLSQAFNQWLNSEQFRPIQDKLLEKLEPLSPVRIIVQTSSITVKRLPWHTWTLCDRYPKAEIALSASAFERLEPPLPTKRQQVRVLAILGNSQGIDIQTDQTLLNALPNAEIKYLVEPQRQQLSQYLWDPQGWDILFFAGHSHTQGYSPTDIIGHLWINQSEKLTISELKHALKRALERGLKIAIFNSCDGLGLAQNLSDLHIPQVLVMQEPVPDQVAHEFLKGFLPAFAHGEPFYLAVREAREKLQGLEDHCPCASWLPMIYQNPAITPPSWTTLVTPPDSQSLVPAATSPVSFRWHNLFCSCLLVISGILGLRYLGLLQAWEIQAYDTFMRSRPHEKVDPRLLVIKVTEADVQSQNHAQRRGSLSDAALSKLLTKLEAGDPQVIGLDIYRDFSVIDDQPQLVEQLQSNAKLYGVCQGSESNLEIPGIPPPPELPSEQVGFSDFIVDPDNTVRRQLIGLTPEPSSPCQATYALNALLAMVYLNSQEFSPEVTADGHLKIGEVVFQALNEQTGPYQTVDTRGHQILLNYRSLPSPEDIAEQVTLGQVLQGQVDPAVFRDRIILIGTTAKSFGDYWSPPSPGQSPAESEVAGVFMQAHMVSQMISAVLDNRPLIRPGPGWMDVLWIISWACAGGLAVGVATWNLPLKSYVGKLGGIILGLEVIALGVSWLALVLLGYWLAWVPAAIAIVGTSGTMALLSMSRFQKNSD